MEKYVAYNGGEHEEFVSIEEAKEWILESTKDDDNTWAESADCSYIAQVLFTTELKTSETAEDYPCCKVPGEICREEESYCKGCIESNPWPYTYDYTADLIFVERE